MTEGVLLIIKGTAVVHINGTLQMLWKLMLKNMELLQIIKQGYFEVSLTTVNSICTNMFYFHWYLNPAAWWHNQTLSLRIHKLHEDSALTISVHREINLPSSSTEML
jgi:hypothetical protein